MFGMVVKADAGVTADSVIIGNPGRGYVMNTNEPMSLATEEHVKARTVDYAAYTIVDGAPLDNKAFALNKKIRLTVSPETATFDLNTEGEGYADVVLTVAVSNGTVTYR